MPVASTDRVSRYTQNVSANQRKLVVTFAIIVFASTWMKMRMPLGGGDTLAERGGSEAAVGACPASDPSNPFVTVR
jgi:hypothetical protein